MNQLDIEEQLDKVLAKAESDLEIVFAKRLKTILFQVSEMYRKYSKNGELSFTQLNLYNRYQKEMQLINEQMTDHYRSIVKSIQEQVEYQYVTKYLLTAYIVEQSITPAPSMGFSIPSIGVIKEALLNPVEFLGLPKVLEQHRNDTVRRLNIVIAQSLINGDGYSEIAKKLENEFGFSSKKARLVARTEAGRSRSIAAEKVFEQAEQYTKMEKIWASMLDMRVRQSHRFLDGKGTGKDGLFHYKKNTTTAPRLWIGPDSASLSIQCRCVIIMKVNGKLPENRRERDYMDDKYQQKLADRIDKYMADDSMTYVQALKKAQKEIQAPSRVVPYVSYEEWIKDKG